MDRLIRKMENFGLEHKGLSLDGKVHRCKCRGSSEDNGWYVGSLHGDNIYCTYGDWRSGEKEQYTDKEDASSDTSKEAWAAINLIAESERVKKHRDAEIRSLKIIDKGVMATEAHQYLLSKRVKPFGNVYLDGDDLFIPLQSPDGEITGGQKISPDGSKKFIPGTQKKGACFIIPGNDSTVCLCEGYATGASIHEATGFKVLVAMDAGNLINVAREAVGRNLFEKILVCADNDHAKPDNAGIEAAEKIKSELQIQYVYPTGIKGTDFNDLHTEDGLESVRAMIIKGKNVEIYIKELNGLMYEKEILSPPGLLKNVADYYNATAAKPQPLFGVAAGILLGSVVMGRRYRTRGLKNFTSLYSVIAAKSGTGKDHLKGTIRKILDASGIGWLERAGGFTAANTVVKSLETQPLQVAFFEEFGQRLQEAGSNKSSAKGMFRQLLDIFSSCHSYTIGDEFADGRIPRVERPALTMIGMTTPKALYTAINADLIEQGFVNRILPFISDVERVAYPLFDGVEEIEPPLEIIEWCKSIWDSGGNLDEYVRESPDEADEIIIDFEPDAFNFLDEIEREVVAMSNKLEKVGLEDLPTRNREITMRVSLIVAMMDGFSTIHLRHVQWSWKLVQSLYERYIGEIKRNVAGSDFEKAKLLALEDLRKRGANGIKMIDMPKKQPWSRWEKKLRDEILKDLEDSGLAVLDERKTGSRGPLTRVWVALK